VCVCVCVCVCVLGAGEGSGVRVAHLLVTGVIVMMRGDQAYVGLARATGQGHPFK